MRVTIFLLAFLLSSCSSQEVVSTGPVGVIDQPVTGNPGAIQDSHNKGRVLIEVANCLKEKNKAAIMSGQTVSSRCERVITAYENNNIKNYNRL